ncbi:MAG: response regulator [Clostridia bacterium]|nr:response regulator [Clostridia bacterium]
MSKHTILIVDDVDFNRIILRDILEEEYNVVEAEDGIQAIDYLFNAAQQPAIVLLDIMMPEMDGHEVLALMRDNPVTERVPVVFITAANATTHEVRGLQEGAQDYIAKPFNQEVVLARVRNLIELNLYRQDLEQQVQKRTDKLMRTRDNMLEAMANMIECRNLESGQHVKRTSLLTELMVQTMQARGMYADELDTENGRMIIKAVPTHDIGKIGIPDDILLKPGRLSSDEFDVIKTHAALGSDIIHNMLADDDDRAFFHHSYDICRHHHERWDGKGYPDSLAGSDIPLSARLLAIVDVYDALTSPRVYKPAMSHEQAKQIILDGSGTQFDPDMVAVFNDLEQEFERVHEMQM